MANTISQGVKASKSLQGKKPEPSQAAKAVSLIYAEQVTAYLRGETGLLTDEQARLIAATIDKLYDITNAVTGANTRSGSLIVIANGLTADDRENLQEVVNGLKGTALNNQMWRDYSQYDENPVMLGARKADANNHQADSSESSTFNESEKVRIVREALKHPTEANADVRNHVIAAIRQIYSVLYRPAFSLEDDELRKAAESGDVCAAESLNAFRVLAENGEERKHWASPMVNVERLPVVARAFLWPEKYAPMHYVDAVRGFTRLDDKLTLEIETAGALNGEQYLDDLIEAQSNLGFLLISLPSSSRNH